MFQEWDSGVKQIRSEFQIFPIQPPIICVNLDKLLLFFWPHRVACGILVPQPGIELRPLAVRARSPNHWTTRDFPWQTTYNLRFLNCKVSVATIPSQRVILSIKWDKELTSWLAHSKCSIKVRYDPSLIGFSSTVTIWVSFLSKKLLRSNGLGSTFLLPVVWRYNEHTALWKFKMYSIIWLYIHHEMTPRSLVNISNLIKMQN